MIHEVALHVHRVQGRYRARRARQSTWVYHVASNACMSIVSHHRTQRYTACATVELPPNVERTVPSAAETEHLREARNAVESVIALASEPACDLLDRVLRGQLPEIPRRSTVGELRDALIHNPAIQDLQRAARASHASLRDFELVLHRA